MEVYTKVPTPFSFGGKYAYIKTDIQEYERVDIGQGYYGIVFRNNHVKLWHIAQEDCGALIGSDISKAKLIKRVKADVGNGDIKTMKLSQAHSFEREEWFKKFRKPK